MVSKTIDPLDLHHHPGHGSAAGPAATAHERPMASNTAAASASPHTEPNALASMSSAGRDGGWGWVGMGGSSP
jgi:hypothetical protein